VSFLSDLGSSLVTSITGASPDQLSAQVTAAEQQLTLAVETIIGLEVVAVAELFLVVVLLWKMRRD
jgi:hypothetical protein